MFDWLTLHLVATVAVALQFGGMSFFAFFFTPLVFKLMAREQAGAFLRQLFPLYDRVMAGLAIVPGLALANDPNAAIELTTMLLVAFTFVMAARYILPAAEKARLDEDQPRFARIHRASVVLHMVQWLAVGVILIRMVD